MTAILKKCHDCQALPGEYHKPGCDTERCPGCGGQMIGCGDCVFDASERMKWDGTWPGTKDCEEFDLWCYWGPPWIICTKDAPGAVHDLNRLAIMQWDRKLQKHVRSSPSR